MSDFPSWTDSVSLFHSVRQDVQRGRPERAFDRLLDCLESRSPLPSLQVKHHALSLLPFVVSRLSGAAATSHRKERAKKVGHRLGSIRSFVGQAEFPAVGENLERCIRVTVFCCEQQDVLPLHLSNKTEQGIRHALEAARNLTSYSGFFCVCLEETEIPLDGASLGLAVGVAAVSAITRREISEHRVFTGEVLPDGQILAVDFVKEKSQLVRESRPLAVLFAPSKNHLDSHFHASCVLFADHIQRVCESGELWGKLDLEDRVRDIQSRFARGDWEEAACRAKDLVADDRLLPDDNMRLRTILLSAANHQGNTDEATEHSAALSELCEQHSLKPEDVALALANRAVRRIDLLKGNEAEELLERTLALHLSQTDEAWIHVRGTWARTKVLLGQQTEALALREQNARECKTEVELPRCLSDLADSYLRLARLEDAKKMLDAAASALQRSLQKCRRIAYLQQTEQYVLVQQIRLCHRLNMNTEVRRLLAEKERFPCRVDLLEIEAALHAERDPLLAVDRVFERHPARDIPIFQALRLRAHILLGQTAAVPVLAKRLGAVTEVPEYDAEDLCLRVPY